ncbi:MAG: signal peptidase [Planctomycetes bacterium]|nr:signal peptidase [Planctomycetota bacterium]
MINLEQFSTVPEGQKEPTGCGSCGTGSALAGQSRCGNGLEKIYPTTAVRLGFMRHIGEFSHAPDMKFTCGAQVVIQSRRGIEIGEQVSLTCNGCDKSVTREQMKEWVSRNGADTMIFDAGRILREATAADLAEYARIQSGARAKRDFARKLAREHELDLKVVECECLFGGERVVFYFTAVERVDFRGMVKDLATEYRTRIEMRQIGARDEARILADYETCGREVCCKVFLKTLKPISMRMAKLQKATLDPSQVSGRCGRLKCCLRYEHVGYEELDKLLPRMGNHIETAHGSGVVINRQILTQLVQIRKEDNTVITVVVEDIGKPEEAPTPESPSRPAPPRSGSSRPERRPAGKAGDSTASRSKLSETPPADAKTEPPAQGERSGVEGAAAETEGKPGEEPPRPRRRRRRRRRRRGDGGQSPSA